MNSICRECSKIRSKIYYKENKEEHKSVTSRNRSILINNNVRIVRLIKENCQCANCGEKEVVCLDFHHTKDKRKEIGVGLHSGWSLNSIITEMKKCVVFCANCHRKYHAGKLEDKEFPLWNGVVP